VLIENYQRSPSWTKLTPRTQQTYLIYLRVIYKDVGDLRIADFTRRTFLGLRDAVASARGHGAAIGLVRATSSLFSWAIDRDFATINPAFKGGRELHRGHLTAWTQEQASIAMLRLSEPLRRVVVLALYTGARRGDLCAMPWSAYDGTYLRFVPQKTRHRQPEQLVIPCLPALKAELDEWRKGALTGIGNATILANARGKPWHPNNVSHQLPEALARIGLTNELNVHGLRKLAARNLAEAGCSSKLIAAITGHASLQMIELYTRSADQKTMAEAAIIRLADHLGQKP
jgi:integrase